MPPPPLPAKEEGKLSPATPLLPPPEPEINPAFMIPKFIKLDPATITYPALVIETPPFIFMLAVVRMLPVNVAPFALELNIMLLPPLYPLVGLKVVPIVVVVEVVVVEVDVLLVVLDEIVDVTDWNVPAPLALADIVPILAKFVGVGQTGLRQYPSHMYPVKAVPTGMLAVGMSPAAV